MRRPLIIDTFPFNNELEMLRCRLEEMAPAVDYFIAVEADVDHQDHPKPYHLTAAVERGEFAEWADKLIVVKATGLPTAADDPDPWARELSQREHVIEGLQEIERRVGLDHSDIILHGDVDEICRALHVRNVRPHDGLVTFEQRLHCFAVDWRHPDPWGGTVAATLGQVFSLGAGPFQKIRNSRNSNRSVLADAGWHLSWLGGKEAALAKLGSFCHPEIADRTLTGLTTDMYLLEGLHVDGRRMKPVEVDSSWPAYIYERRCPAVWFRPRRESPLRAEYERLCVTPSDIYEHLPRMVEMVKALNAQHVIELGTRSGVSTIAWLHALHETGGRLTSIDLDPAPPIGEHEHWRFIQGDDMEGHALAAADIVFIDTSHHYQHTLAELRKYAKLVKPGGVIVCHDTELMVPEALPDDDPLFPVKRAIERFVAETGFQWVNFPECNGLGVIKVG